MPAGKTLAANEQALASDIMSMLGYGLASGLPATAAVVRDSFYWETDTKILKQEHNGTWVETSRGETVIRLAQLAEKAFASLTGRVGKSQMEWAANKILLGAGVGSDPTEIDVPTSPLTLVDAEVFNGTSPGASAWTDLNLSGVVGANPAIVWLRAYNANAGTKYFAFRPNGETEFSSISFTDTIMVANIGGTSFDIFICPTDAGGIIEWRYEATSQAGVTIDVIAYIK